MARKKKEPINITPPTPPQFLVKSERVKVVVMFNGDNVICDLQEAVDKESGQRQACLLYTFLMKNHDLKLHLLASSKMTSKSIRSMERYMSKQAKKNQKMMERMSIKDWHNVPSNEHGRSPIIQRLDPSSLQMDSLESYWEK